MKRCITLILLLILIAGCSAEPTMVPTASPTPLSTSSPIPPTSTVTSSPTATQPTERSGLIAFYMNNGSMGGIFVMNANGSGEPVMLSAHPTSDSKPSWSPDGKKIAFESLRDDVLDKKFMDIYIMDADGSHLTKLTNTDGWYSEPEWSPDGKRILVTSHGPDDENYDLYVMDLINGDTVRLTDDPAKDTSASWSPDGTQVVFSSNRGGKWNIYTINVETGDTNQLTSDAGDNAHADWSPDGEKILFISNRDGDVEIFVMDADGENPKRVTNFPGPDNNPEWSPDGQYFAFSHGDAAFGEIYTSSLDSDSPIRLFENKTKYAGYPAWSATATKSSKPTFGPPMCLRDADGDLVPETVTKEFPESDLFPFVSFPFRNMPSNVSWSIAWDYEDSDKDSLNMGLAWKEGESGWYTAMASGFNLGSIGPRKVKVKLSIGNEVVQEIECEIVASKQSLEESTNTPQTLFLRSRCGTSYITQADNPLEIQYGAWLALGEEQAVQNAQHLRVKLVLDSKTIQGVQQPVVTGSEIPCGALEGLYGVFFNAHVDSLSKGIHTVSVTWIFDEQVTDGLDTNSDGTPDTYGPGEIATEEYTIVVE